MVVHANSLRFLFSPFPFPTNIYLKTNRILYGIKMRATKNMSRTTRFPILFVLRLPTLDSNFDTLFINYGVQGLIEVVKMILQMMAYHFILATSNYCKHLQVPILDFDLFPKNNAYKHVVTNLSLITMYYFLSFR